MKVLFFAPHSAIWVHAFPEAIIADVLQGAGHQVVYASCGGAFQRYCVPMSASKLLSDASSEERATTCRTCGRYDQLLRKEFGLEGPDLHSLLTPEDLAETEMVVARAQPEMVQTIEHEGVPVGRVALYQLAIRSKRINLDLVAENWDEYLTELRNTVLALLAARHLLDSHKPDRVIVYNGLYSVNRAACLLAEARGIPALFLHAGVNLSNRLQTLMLGRYDTFSYYPRLVAGWNRFSDVPCSTELLSQVTNHYLQLIEARSIFVYSKGKSTRSVDVRARFGVKPDQKMIVATLGSYDEEVAAEMVGARKVGKAPLFKTQVEWIEALRHFVAQRPDIFLVVRVHPREFPNRRDTRKSEHAMLLEQAVSNLPDNVAVNWPADNISIYDLVEDTDVFLNSWSSTGKDMALLGIPTVIYSDELPLYPSELNYFGDTEESYFEAIDRALADGWSAETIRKSYRWAVYEFTRSTIYIGDSFDEIETRKRTLLERVVDRAQRSLDEDFRQRRNLKKYARPRAADQVIDVVEAAARTVVDCVRPDNVQPVAPEEEAKALRIEMRRLAEALFPSSHERAGSRLYARLTAPELFN